jgi:hypothetical protein
MGHIAGCRSITEANRRASSLFHTGSHTKKFPDSSLLYTSGSTLLYTHRSTLLHANRPT